jgi:transposase
MARHGLTNEAWELLKPMLPDEEEVRPGRPWASHRQVISGILWILRAGAPWRDLPSELGPWITVYMRFRRWQLDGTWTKIMETLQIRLNDEGLLDDQLWCVDSTINRGTRAAGGAPKKVAMRRSRKITLSVTPAAVSRQKCTL